MTGIGHKITGLLSSAIAASCLHVSSATSAFLLVIACVFGATAPDWLEIAWHGMDGKRKSIIPHRKITHWVPLWIGLLCYGLHHLSGAHQMLLVGFSVGGITHLICDIPNPSGVPVLHPWKNISLKLWRSGENEVQIILVFGIIAYFSLNPPTYLRGLFL